MQTVQNSSAKRVNEGIRTPTDIIYINLRPCNSWFSLPLDMALDFLMCEEDVDNLKFDTPVPLPWSLF